MKKALALLVAMMMLVLALPAVAEQPAIDTSEHVTVTYLVTGDIPTNRTDEVLAKINEILNEKVNATLEIRWIEWTNWTTNYNLARFPAPERGNAADLCPPDLGAGAR